MAPPLFENITEKQRHATLTLTLPMAASASVPPEPWQSALQVLEAYSQVTRGDESSESKG